MKGIQGTLSSKVKTRKKRIDDSKGERCCKLKGRETKEFLGLESLREWFLMETRCEWPWRRSGKGGGDSVISAGILSENQSQGHAKGNSVKGWGLN